MSAHPDAGRLSTLDELSGSERDSLLAHVAGCRACRSVLVADNPSRIFSLLAGDPVPADALESLSSRVSAALDSEEKERRSAPAGHWRGVAGLAASVLVAIGFGALLTTRDLPAPRASSTAQPVGLAELRDPGEPATDAWHTQVGGIEVLDSRGRAQVLDLSVGQTQVVMIFDEELDI
jgi:hypothetical protein